MQGLYHQPYVGHAKVSFGEGQSCGLFEALQAALYAAGFLEFRDDGAQCS